MATEPLAELEIKELFRRAYEICKDLDISAADIWFIYKTNGGTKGQESIKDYLRGDTEPPATQANLLARVVNKILEDNGQNPFLPEWSFRIRPVSGGGRPMQIATDQESLRFFTQTDADQGEKAA